MIITLDATPLLGRLTGVGQYAQHLIAELPGAAARRGLDAEIRVTTWTARGARLTSLPPGVRQVGLRLPARALRSAWMKGDHPTIEALVGRCDVFHGTNFVSPPTRSAREVVTIHDLTYAIHQGTVSADSLQYRTLVPRALDRGALVVTPSEAVAAAVRDFYGLPADRVTATPLGVGHEWFAATGPTPTWLAEHRLPADYLVFVGSIDPRKNLPRLLAAHARLRAEVPDSPDLVLAGPAGRETSLGDRPGLHVTGWLEDADLRRLVAGSRALVLPSIDEGFGLPALEALACGRPVVVSDIPALREVTGPHAITAPHDDAEALALALLTALSAPDDDPARTARRTWASAWTWSRCADQTLSAYTHRTPA